jgi:hypothetical protein
MTYRCILYRRSSSIFSLVKVNLISAHISRNDQRATDKFFLLLCLWFNIVLYQSLDEIVFLACLRKVVLG